MADKKISQLPNASTPLAGTEVLPIVQSSSTVKVASDDLTVKNVRSNATTGILQIAGPGTGTTRVMTTPNANFTAARTDAAQTFTGTQSFTSDVDANGVRVGKGASSGINNTVIGVSAGSAMTTGAKNTILGSYTGIGSGLDMRTLSNKVVLADGDGTVVQYYSGTATTSYAPQVSYSIIRFAKSVSVAASATTNLLTFTQDAYSMDAAGKIHIMFLDETFPNSVLSAICNLAITAAAADIIVRDDLNVVDTAAASNGGVSFTIGSTESKTGGNTDGVFNVNVTTGADTSGTAYVVWEGFVRPGTVIS